jgi:hypothetical protein
MIPPVFGNPALPSGHATPASGPPPARPAVPGPPDARAGERGDGSHDGPHPPGRRPTASDRRGRRPGAPGVPTPRAKVGRRVRAGRGRGRDPVPGRPGGHRLRGLRPRRRPQLDPARRLRRRAAGGARRPADRPGPHRPPAARQPPRSADRQPAPGRGERLRAALPLRRPALHLRAGDPGSRGDLPEAPRRPVGGRLPHPVQLLHLAGPAAGPDVDPGLDQRVGPRRRRLQARPAPRGRLHHRVRRRRQPAERPEPLVPARLLRPGPAAHLRPLQ